MEELYISYLDEDSEYYKWAFGSTITRNQLRDEFHHPWLVNSIE